MSVNEYFMIAPLTKTPGQRQRVERNEEIRLRYSKGESVDALAIAFDLSRRAITGMVYKQNLRPPVEKPPKKVKGFSARDQTIRELFATKGQNAQKIADQY